MAERKAVVKVSRYYERCIFAFFGRGNFVLPPIVVPRLGGSGLCKHTPPFLRRLILAGAGGGGSEGSVSPISPAC